MPGGSDVPVVGGLLGTVADLLTPITDPWGGLQQTVVQTRFGTPRTVAGDSIETLTNKCQLKPVDPADYPLALDPQGFAEQVAEVFPQGVCDYSKPGEGVAPTETWLQYGDAEKVNYGRLLYQADDADASARGGAGGGGRHDPRHKRPGTHRNGCQRGRQNHGGAGFGGTDRRALH